MKHIPALLCCFALLFALAACGKQEMQTPAEQTQEETPAETDATAAKPDKQDPAESEHPDEADAPEEPAADESLPRIGASHILTLSESPASFDWDGDGKGDTFIFGSETPDRDSGILDIALSGSGETYRFDEVYVVDFAAIRFTDVDHDSTPELFLSGTDGTDYFLTYAWKLQDGIPTAMRFADPAGTQQTYDTEDYVLGKVCDELDANGNLCMEQIIHLLGTRGALCSYTPDDSGALVRLDDSIWTLIGENAPLRTIRELPAYTLRERNAMPADGAPDMTLPAGIDITPTGVLLTKDGGILCFETPDGSFGALRAVRQDSWYIGSISEYDAFEVLPYAG